MTNKQYEELKLKKYKADSIYENIDQSKQLIKMLEDHLDGKRHSIMTLSAASTMKAYYLRDDQANALLILERNRLSQLEKEFSEL